MNAWMVETYETHINYVVLLAFQYIHFKNVVLSWLKFEFWIKFS